MTDDQINNIRSKLNYLFYFCAAFGIGIYFVLQENFKVHGNDILKCLSPMAVYMSSLIYVGFKYHYVFPRFDLPVHFKKSPFLFVVIFVLQIIVTVIMFYMFFELFRYN